MNHALSALIIDDEPDICELLDMTLSRMNIQCAIANNVVNAKTLLERKNFNICLTDMRLPDGSGLDIVRFIQGHCPSLPVAVITAHGNVDVAVESLKAGAFDFLSKPVNLANLRTLVQNAIASNQMPEPTIKIKSRLLGDSPIIRALGKNIGKLARSQAPVYITGESGSGKELVARSMHERGPRADAPFLAVNCGAIPRELMESEFFGHKKGAFTGAHQDKEGLFRAAEGGTLFLDEVADLPLDMQVKLLRAIQEKAVRAIGGSAEEPFNVRILCATHKDLEAEVAEGRFRQDLFYRLNVIQLNVPPLRDRKEDVVLLTHFLLDKLAKDMSAATLKISPQALNELERYQFPGNVRELENILERAFTLCETDTIESHDLQLKHNAILTENLPATHTAVNHYERALQFENIDEYLADIEKDIILGSLEKLRWNKTMAAKELGVTFRSLRYRMQKLGLEED
ncbi:sigma-54-dependent transcriptional regulator [Marinagarivorans algicola]|uniref:sigma-54-dependent transcriptional regulator n=1 Tax=Marinagarivorans algicola TaxID=1513270 RepID=UPI0037369F5A